jgi:hypothetical protein
MAGRSGALPYLAASIGRSDLLPVFGGAASLHRDPKGVADSKKAPNPRLARMATFLRGSRCPQCVDSPQRRLLSKLESLPLARTYTF